MQEALIISQTVLFSVLSLAIILFGVVMGIIAYHVIKIVRELEQISRTLHEASEEAGERIKDILERLSDVPILSYFLRRPRAPKSRKSKTEK